MNFTFRVPPELLLPYLPKHLILELNNGHSFVSLVAFDFLDTRVLGMPIPFHVNFPEVNLRFYVRYGEHRGVVFIREFVNRRMVAYVAKRLYNEPYRAIKMKSSVEVKHEFREVSHILHGNGIEHELSVRAKVEVHTPEDNTEEHFFKEHTWGFGTGHDGKTKFYEVQHPLWEVYPIVDWKLDVDFGKLYGEQWAFLNGARPHHTIYACGSAISVFNSRNLEEFPL